MVLPRIPLEQMGWVDNLWARSKHRASADGGLARVGFLSRASRVAMRPFPTLGAGSCWGVE
jgi:hypothetical protein